MTTWHGDESRGELNDLSGMFKPLMNNRLGATSCVKLAIGLGAFGGAERAPLWGQFPECQEVTVAAAFVDPFDPGRMHLASFNESVTEFFGYPSWRVLDASGNELAAETVNFFGLVDTTWHELGIENALGGEAQPVVWELTYSTVEGPQTCQLAGDLTPWVPTADVEALCMPIHVHAWGTLNEGSGFHLEVRDLETNEPVLGLEMSAEAGEESLNGVLAEVCLSLDHCYEVAWSSAGLTSSAAGMVGFRPADWGPTAWFDYWTLWWVDAAEGTTVLDAYDPSCEPSSGGEMGADVVLGGSWRGPNPFPAERAAPEAWRGATVHDVAGRFLGHVSQDGAWPPNASGWVVLRQANERVKVWVAR